MTRGSDKRLPCTFTALVEILIFEIRKKKNAETKSDPETVAAPIKGSRFGRIHANGKCQNIRASCSYSLPFVELFFTEDSAAVTGSSQTPHHPKGDARGILDWSMFLFLCLPRTSGFKIQKITPQGFRRLFTLIAASWCIMFGF